MTVREGRVLSWTVVRSAPAGFDAPYAVALVELDDGGCVLARSGLAEVDLTLGVRVRVREGVVPELV